MKRTVKSKEKLIKWFKKHGWVKCAVGWENPANSNQCFANDMFMLCGYDIKLVKIINGDYDYEDGEELWFWKSAWLVKKEKSPCIK